MKKLVAAALFVFAILYISIITSGLLYYQATSDTAKLNANNNASINDPTNSTSSTIVLNAQEVAKHNSASSCWMIIGNKVYDITSYLRIHPGGPGTILPYCGADGTAAFGGKPHSQYAQSLLVNYYVGNLNAQITTTTTSTPTQPTTSTQSTQPPATPLRRYEDD